MRRAWTIIMTTSEGRGTTTGSTMQTRIDPDVASRMTR